MTTQEKRDVFQEITNNIIEQLESAQGGYSPLWIRSKGLPTNVISKAEYNGINILSLWAAQLTKGYNSSTWGTYKQWSDKKCQVRKGEKATLIVFYKTVTKKLDDGKEDHIPFATSASVFNSEQVEGYEFDAKLTNKVESLDQVEKFINSTKAQITIGGDSAHYSTKTDSISVPDKKLFLMGADTNETQNYYSVLMHELIHWTGDKNRLDRNLKNKFGTASYAFEELVAELGSSFLCAKFGIAKTASKENVEYIADWIKLLKGNKKAVFTAAAMASKAVSYLESLQAD